tara:strand:+ start:1593 stop:1742 length:150 start_codon:yes stop_codon:yes gene_type:complete
MEEYYLYHYRRSPKGLLLTTPSIDFAATRGVDEVLVELCGKGIVKKYSI